MSEHGTAPFEEKLARIDVIVKQLDEGQVALDQAVELYEEAKKLVAECETLLKGAQEKLDHTST